MRVVIQRVTQASVSIQGECKATIQKGFVILSGYGLQDSVADVRKMAKKCVQLRVFEDAQGKLRYDLAQVGGSILSISQFTLYADCKKGRRPGFEQVARAETAKPLYDVFNEELKQSGIPVGTGVFGGDMQVSLCNDGPLTILLDSENI